MIPHHCARLIPLNRATGAIERNQQDPRHLQSALAGSCRETLLGAFCSRASEPSSMQRLLKRRDFLFVREGRRAHAATLSLQARRRESVGAAEAALPAPEAVEPRVGFTVTKKEGCAVERNRIRRRLREAVRLSGALHARDGYDYVVLGRRSALDASFATIVDEMVTAFGRVHSERQGARKPRRSADEAVR